MLASRISCLVSLVAVLLTGCDPTELNRESDVLLVYPDSVDRGSVEPYAVTRLVCPNRSATASISRTFEPGEAADSLVLNGHRLIVPGGVARERPVTFTLTHHQHSRYLQLEATSEPANVALDTPLVLGLSFAACASVSDPQALRIIREDDSTDRGGRAQERWIFTSLDDLSTYTLASPF